MAITIKEARVKLGLTQKQMADLLGMSQHRVSEIERGVGGRAETKGHIAHIVALNLLNEHGFIADLATKLKED